MLLYGELSVPWTRESAEGERGLAGKSKKKPKKTGPAPGKPPQRQRNKSQLRMRILRAAMHVFGRLGYVDTRVEDILTEAEISRPTFYRYFKSKEDVFDAVDEVLSMSFLQTWTSAIESVEDPLEKIEKGADAYLRWLQATGPIAGVTLQESSRPGSRLGPRREAALRIIVDVFHSETRKALGEEYDPWLFSMLQVATEHAGQLVIREGIREKDMERAKRSMVRILVGTLYDRDLPGAPLPKAPREAKPKKGKS